MERNDRVYSTPEPLESMSMPGLLGRLFRDTGELLKKEVELARAELAGDVKALMSKIVAFAFAGLCALVGLGLLSAAAVLGLAGYMPAWQAALLVGAVLFVIAGIAGAVASSKKSSKPLKRTQRTLKENVQWAKERMA